MSRTDKDAPLWTRATVWEPKHYRCQYASFGRGRRECDLPPAPPSRTTYRYPGYWHTFKVCAWEPDLNSFYPDGLYPLPGPNKWFVDHVGHNVERRRSRDECIEARKEHRATGEVDIMPTVNQARHQAWWLFW